MRGQANWEQRTSTILLLKGHSNFYITKLFARKPPSTKTGWEYYMNEYEKKGFYPSAFFSSSFFVGCIKSVVSNFMSRGSRDLKMGLRPKKSPCTSTTWAYLVHLPLQNGFQNTGWSLMSFERPNNVLSAFMWTISRNARNMKRAKNISSKHDRFSTTNWIPRE